MSARRAERMFHIVGLCRSIECQKKIEKRDSSERESFEESFGLTKRRKYFLDNALLWKNTLIGDRICSCFLSDANMRINCDVAQSVLQDSCRALMGP